MHTLDEKDQQILRLLRQNARIPFSRIAEEVDLSGPAVSDRVDRLEQTGIITSYTIDIDQSQLRNGISVLVQITTHPTDPTQLTETLQHSEKVEHVFITANGKIWFTAYADESKIRESLQDLLESSDIEFEVVLLDEISWTPSISTMEFDLSCAECGNSVDEQGTSWRTDDTEYRFCCPSCEAQFKERYQEFEQAA